jgi:hypothetical protein
MRTASGQFFAQFSIGAGARKGTRAPHVHDRNRSRAPQARDREARRAPSRERLHVGHSQLEASPNARTGATVAIRWTSCVPNTLPLRERPHSSRATSARSPCPHRSALPHRFTERDSLRPRRRRGYVTGGRDSSAGSCLLCRRVCRLDLARHRERRASALPPFGGPPFCFRRVPQAGALGRMQAGLAEERRVTRAPGGSNEPTRTSARARRTRP